MKMKTDYCGSVEDAAAMNWTSDVF